MACHRVVVENVDNLFNKALNLIFDMIQMKFFLVPSATDPRNRRSARCTSTGNVSKSAVVGVGRHARLGPFTPQPVHNSLRTVGIGGQALSWPSGREVLSRDLSRRP